MGSTKPMGLDPSLRGFGVSCGKDTIVICTQPSDLQTQSQNNQRRCQEIVAKIVAFVNKNYDSDDIIMFVLEGMSMNSFGANHLAEMGFLFSELYNRLPSMINRPCTICEIPPSGLKQWVHGKGNADKAQMKESVKERWGIEFEMDTGGNKTDAYCLYKYGIAIIEGIVEFVPMARRGQGKAAKQKRKATAKKNAIKKSSPSESPESPDSSCISRKAPVSRRPRKAPVTRG